MVYCTECATDVYGSHIDADSFYEETARSVTLDKKCYGDGANAASLSEAGKAEAWCTSTSEPLVSADVGRGSVLRGRIVYSIC